MIKEFVRQATLDDVEFLIENIRPEDVEELDALDGSTVRKALDETENLLENSQVWEVEGEMVCMFGVTPLQDDDEVGVIWMLATTEFEQYSMMFAARCKKVVEKMLSGYEYVFNYVHSKNVKSIRWLKWLGFHICDPEPLGKKGATFHRFEIVNV